MMLSDPDPQKSKRVMQARRLQMKEYSDTEEGLRGENPGMGEAGFGPVPPPFENREIPAPD
jgi:hypothetical protein